MAENVTRRHALAAAAVSLGGAGCAAPTHVVEGAMERVQGIGGFFFRSRNPQELAMWYNNNLGISLVPQSYESTPWITEAGPTIFAPFEQDSELFGDSRNQWVMNFRVQSLDAMAAQIQANGTPVEIDPVTYPNGRFGKLADPEGNPIQLWEPNQRSLRP